MEEENSRPVFGEVCLRNKRRKRQKKLLKQLFEDYAERTTLHGLRYIAEKGLHIVEKIFWFMTFLLSVALSFYLISKVWIKWTTSPVIVSFSENHVYVHEIPFPAVTICPAVKFLQSHFNYTEVKMDLNNPNKTVDNETIAKADAIGMVCDVPEGMSSLEQGSLAVERLINMTVNTGNILLGCLLGTRGCTTKFKRVLTRDGVCFTFNGLPAHDILNFDNVHQDYKYSYSTEEVRNWTLTEGYTDKDEFKAYPHRGQESGEIPYMSLWLTDLEHEKDKLCNALQSGYKVYVHHPAEWPQSLTYHFTALPEKVASLALTFSMVTTSKSLESASIKVYIFWLIPELNCTVYRAFAVGATVAPLCIVMVMVYIVGCLNIFSNRSTRMFTTILIPFLTIRGHTNIIEIQRQCYFLHERPLKYFKIYSYHHCRLECLTNFTYQECGCVSFYMPFNDSSLICTSEQARCVLESSCKYLYIWMISLGIIYGDVVRFTSRGGYHLKKCECLPSCDLIEYDAEFLRTDFNYDEFVRAQERFYAQIDESEYEPERATDAKVEIFFKRPIFLAVYRSELFGLTDFLGICGGLLGLFLGFSFLSIVEVFYFLTFRVYKTIKTDLKNEKRDSLAQVSQKDTSHDKTL